MRAKKPRLTVRQGTAERRMSSQGQDAGIQCQVGHVTTALTERSIVHCTALRFHQKANFCLFLLFPPGTMHWTSCALDNRILFSSCGLEHDRYIMSWKNDQSQKHQTHRQLSVGSGPGNQDWLLFGIPAALFCTTSDADYVSFIRDRALFYLEAIGFEFIGHIMKGQLC